MSRDAIRGNLQARLDRQAADQLRAELVRLEAENHRLRFELEETESQLHWADQVAESWRDDFFRLEESLAPNQAIGLTQSGALVLMDAPAAGGCPMSLHANEALKHLQAIPERLLARAATGTLDLNQLAASALADKGLDQHGNWIGHQQAADALAGRQPTLSAEIREHISRRLMLRLEDAIAIYRDSATLAVPATAAHLRSQSIGAAAELFAIADFLGVAEYAQCLRERWADATASKAAA